MESMYRAIQKVETMQKAVDHDIKLFKIKSGIDCCKHCSECCNFAEILATPLEFLPFAWHAFKIGQLDHWFNIVDQASPNSSCIFHRQQEGNWGCEIYPARGLICRLFGFSASTDKNGKPVYAACRTMKQQKSDLVNLTRDLVSNGAKIPIMANQYRKLASIDPVMGNNFLPINQAVKKALEIVYFHFEYSSCA